MPLPLPRLDNRTFDQLVAEGQVLLSRYAPGWTDYNAHDPGITLLELLAWLAETGFYRLDRVPPASYRAFLRLAGVVPRPAQVAETVVFPASPAAAATVPAGTRVESADGRVVFQTTHETGVSAADLVALLSGRDGELIDRSRERAAFAALGVVPQVGDALYVGFDGPLASTHGPLGFYVVTGDEARDRRTRALLQAEWESVAAEALRDSLPVPSAGVIDVRDHYGARVVWEYHTGSGVWAALAAVEDQTRALTLSGLVRFEVPAAAHAPGGISLPEQSTRYFVRCRLASGRYDCAPRIQTILHNALGVRHALDKPRQKLGLSTGRAGQTFDLGAAQVVPGSTRVEVIANGLADSPWREAPVWDGIGPHDRAYVLADDRGEIVFGDGRIGRVPPAEATIWAAYQAGGGPSGNIAPDTLTELGSTSSALKVTQPFAALGGEPAEDLELAIGRALAKLAAPSRAVTLKDFEDVVLAMPGVPIARVHALADYHPDLLCLPALGSVTVVVVPHCPPARPEPSPELLCAVVRHLERRRTLTTELHVVGPCYTTVSVRARLHPVAGADGPKLAGHARAALERFLDPLLGGPDGMGWPIGRDVYRAEVMALLNDLPGVAYVDEVVIQIGDQPGARCGNATVCRHGLVASGTHAITIASGSRCQ